VVIEDTTDGKRDAILLSASFINVMHPEFIRNLEQSLLWPEDIQSSEKSVEITLEIEEGLLIETNRTCAELGVSSEQLLLAFIRFCTSIDNYPALKEFLNYCKMKGELEEIKEDLQKLQEDILEIKQGFKEDCQNEKGSQHSENFWDQTNRRC